MGTACAPSVGKRSNEFIDVTCEIFDRETRDRIWLRDLAPLQCRADRLDELSAIIWIDSATDSAVSERVATAIAIAADHRQARGGSFEKDNAKALASARHGKEIGDREVIRQIGLGNFPGKFDDMRNAFVDSELLEAGAIVPGSYNQVRGVGHLPENFGKGSNNAVVPLVAFSSRKPPDSKDDAFAG